MRSNNWPAEPMLAVVDLTVEFSTARGTVRAVEDLSFEVAAGETVALVGESGSGKSVTCLSVMRLLSTATVRVTGLIRLGSRQLLELTDDEMRSVRGREIAMVFQEPMTSLNPVFTIGSQIAETVRAHETVNRKAAADRAIDLLETVGITDARRRAREYPHQLSGGMRQRVMIAIALACQPAVLIADEPTTALDVTVQAQILDLLRSLQEEFGMGLLFVTHDLGVVAQIADRVVVMYAGQAVEAGPVADVFLRPRMPYTAGLLKSVPRPGDRRARLAAIEGEVPGPLEVVDGCRFHPRCDHVIAACRERMPDVEPVSDGHAVRCSRWRALRLDGVKPVQDVE